MVDEVKPPQNFEQFEEMEQQTPSSFEQFEQLESQRFGEEPEEMSDEEYDRKFTEEMELREKYGDGLDAIRAFFERTAGSASYGLSDQAAVKALGPEMKEALKQRKRLNPTASALGDIAGIIGPMFFSGGASLLGKGAQLGGRGVVAGAKSLAKKGWLAPGMRAAGATEKLTAKGIQSLIGDRVKKKVAKDVIVKGVSKGAGAGVEAALWNTGQLVSENALGNKEFNAENLLAYGGEGALWGGLIGAGFGAAPSLFKGAVEIVVPKVKNNKMVGWGTKKIKNWREKYASVERNAYNMAGVDDIDFSNLQKANPDIIKNTPKILQKVAKEEGFGFFDDSIKLKEGLDVFKKKTGRKIGQTLNAIDELDQSFGDIYPTKSQVALEMDSALVRLQDNLVDEFGNILPSKKKSAQFNAIQQIREELESKLTDQQRYTAKGLYKMKVQYDKGITFQKGTHTIGDEIDIVLGDVVRKQIYDLADKAPLGLGNKLRKQMLDFATASAYNKHLARHIKNPNRGQYDFYRDLTLGGLAAGMFDMVGLAGIGVGLRAFSKSDLYNRVQVLTGVETANQGISKTIKDSAKGFLSKKNFTKSVEPVSKKVLMASPLSVYNQQKPKDEVEAMQNISENLNDIKANPSKLGDMSKNDLLDVIAPETFGAMKGVAGRALVFLDSKLPLMFSVNPLLKKKYRPSTQELYKFKKYLEAIQNPVKVFKEFSKGNISRESIEAISFVYPDIYARMRAEVMKDVQANPDSIDYKQRLLLGTLLDAPTDLALLPESIKSLQQFYSEAAVSKSGGKIPVTAAKEINMADSAATQLEKLTNPKLQ
tara:strand:+ start:13178 stop:15643 length:2466 start_codon:yes stop_codon:yes gene_type:complete